MSTDYHNSEDLRRATGVEFPKVIPVDSIYHDDWNRNYIRVLFVPVNGMTKKDFQKLDRACVQDPCCWKKEKLGYHYEIYPERPLDRTKGTHRRTVEIDNGDGTTQVIDDRMVITYLFLFHLREIQ